jgi:hypothetical protein
MPNAPQLAAPSAAPPTVPVDGIRCLGNEQLRFHIHAHLAVYVNGAARRLPGGIGIVSPQVSQTAVETYVGAGGCFYWLHTYAADGNHPRQVTGHADVHTGRLLRRLGQRLGERQLGPATEP